MLLGRFPGLVLSLFLPAFYRHVARNWNGIGLLYLFLLFTLTWIPVLVKMQWSVQKVAQEEFPKIAPKLPTITIKGGKVSSPIPQPFEIKDDTGKTVFVLDTTGQIKSLEQLPGAVMLITETAMHTRDEFGRTQIQDLSQFPDFEFSAAFVQQWVDFGATWLWAVVYPFAMIGSFIRALVIMFIAAIVGLIVNAATGAGVSFGGLLRMAAVGMTMSVYIDTGLMLAEIPVPFYFFIATVLTIIYVAFGTIVSGQPRLGAADAVREGERTRGSDYPDDYK